MQGVSSEVAPGASPSPKLSVEAKYVKVLAEGLFFISQLCIQRENCSLSAEVGTDIEFKVVPDNVIARGVLSGIILQSLWSYVRVVRSHFAIFSPGNAG